MTKTKNKINPSEKIDRADEIIKELIKIHQLIAKEVDFEVQDKKLACHFLLGSQISLASRAIRAIEEGWMEDVGQYQRILTESMDLILFFCESDDVKKHLNAWFLGNKIRSNRDGEKLPVSKRAIFLNTEERTIQNINQTIKIANDRLSKYFHPSYEMVTMTFDFKQNKFRYYSKRGEILSKDRIKGLSRLVLNDVVFSFGICLSKLFLLNTSEHLEKTANFTRELWPESFS